MKSIDLTAIIQAFILLISSVITVYILPKVKLYLTEKLSAEQRENLKKWVRVAVAAAEQLYGSKKGQEKKDYVVSFLLSKGIVFNIDEVTALIESEVYKLTQGSGYFVAVPEGDNEPSVFDEHCDAGGVPTENTEPSVPDETAEADNIETDHLFSARNTCE